MGSGRDAYADSVEEAERYVREIGARHLFDDRDVYHYLDAQKQGIADAASLADFVKKSKLYEKRQDLERGILYACERYLRWMSEQNYKWLIPGEKEIRTIVKKFRNEE
jgi:hypothetical protein